MSNRRASVVLLCNSHKAMFCYYWAVQYHFWTAYMLVQQDLITCPLIFTVVLWKTHWIFTWQKSYHSCLSDMENRCLRFENPSITNSSNFCFRTYAAKWFKKGSFSSALSASVWLCSIKYYGCNSINLWIKRRKRFCSQGLHVSYLFQE